MPLLHMITSLKVLTCLLSWEAHDEHLSKFLQMMISKGLLEDTLVILQSDHGLQGGPAMV